MKALCPLTTDPLSYRVEQGHKKPPESGGSEGSVEAAGVEPVGA